MRTSAQAILFLLATLTAAAPVNNTEPFESQGVANRDLTGPVTFNIENRLPGTPALRILGAYDSGANPPTKTVDGKFTSSTSIVVPWGWAGEFTINKDSSDPFADAGSRIEGDNGFNDPDELVFVDVSYVVGYSVPITCSCENTVVTGCNIELFSRGTCPNQLGSAQAPVCVNTPPKSGGVDPFFAPCSGAVYTYSKDDGSTQGCPMGTKTINCCVGTSCQAPARQGH